MQKKKILTKKPETLKKIKDISVTEDECFGMLPERTFLQEVHFLRDKVAPRLNSLTTGYHNIAEEYRMKLISKELVEIELFCCGHEDIWFLIIKRDGTIAFEKREGKSKSGESYEIPSNWDDKKILNYAMPERLVKEHLKRIYWIPVCFEALLHKTESKLADALALAADKELKKANDARKELSTAINSMKDEIKRLETAQSLHDDLSDELKEFKSQQKARLLSKEKILAEKRKIKVEADEMFKSLSQQIKAIEAETSATHTENRRLQEKVLKAKDKDKKRK